MIKPKMIIFDYGHTLLYEPNHDTDNGNRAIWNYVKSNPYNVTFDEFNRTVMALLAEVKAERGPNIEVHEHCFLQMVMDYLGIELSVSIPEAEQIIWYGISKGAKMPYVDEMLEFMDQQGIRTGVISNLCFSGEALKERLNRFLPNNKFEFVLTSSEYVFTKPNRMMFDVALKKAGLTPDEVWYCGDSIAADVVGAHNAGIFPVLYNGETDEENDPMKKINDGLKVDCEHLYIEDWREFIKVLENMIEK
ncbi:MAG: HAD family hydrolase [Lachnospiraceae bacterium]|nr:HAD family hydrolase [Lachnospiraceae bacterium]